MVGMFPNLNPSGPEPQGLAQQAPAMPQQPPVIPQQPQQEISGPMGGKGMSALAGMGMAAAFGANPLAGLLVAAPLFQHARVAAHRGNEDRRYQLDQRAAQQELGGMLAGGTPEQQIAGLLLRGYPSSASQVAGSILGRADPADIRTMRQLGYPITPEGFAQYQAAQQGPQDATDALLAQLLAEQRQQDLDDRRRQAAEAERIEKERRDAQVRSLNSGLNGLVKWAELNEELSPTLLSSGATSEQMKTFISGREFAKRALGLDASEDTALLTKYDRFFKLSNDILLRIIPSLEGINANTDARLQQIKDSLGGVGVQPGANAAIAASNIRELLSIAQDNGIEVSEMRKVLETVNKLESGLPLLGGDDDGGDNGSPFELPPGMTLEEAIQDDEIFKELIRRGIISLTGEEG